MKNKAINTVVFNEFPVLESKRLKLRAFTEEDAGMLFSIRSNDMVMKYMDSDYHASVQDALGMIYEINKDFSKQKGINWVIENKAEGKMIGYAGIWRMQKENLRGEIGFALHPDYWKGGYMKETLMELIAFAFSELNLHSLEANVNKQNDSSMVLLERIGFKKEAYFRENYYFNGRFIDSVIYSLLEKDIK